MSLFLPHRRFLFGARAFDLDAWLAANNGAYFDFARTDTTFQEAVGPTAADDVGEAIGLVLSRAGWGTRMLAQVVADAQEMCVNGTFDSDLTGWQNASDGTSYISWSAGRASLNFVVGTVRMRQGPIAVVPGRVVRFAATVVSGTIAISLGSALGGTQYANQVASSSTVLFSTTTAAGYYIGWYGGQTTVVDDNSVKEVARHSALQATASYKPARQSAGVKGDGADDNLLTNYYAGAAGNVFACVITAPASIAATQILGGAASGTDRGYLALDTSGRLCAGVGTDTVSTIVGTSDLRGRRAFVALVYDGAEVRLIVDDTVEYRGVQHGVATTAYPYRLLAQNNAGTAATFTAATVEKALVANAAPTAAQIAKIKASLMA